MTDHSASTLVSIERFKIGEITLEDLREDLMNECAKSPIRMGEINVLLKAELVAGLISAEIYDILIAGLPKSVTDDAALLSDLLLKDSTEEDAETIISPGTNNEQRSIKTVSATSTTEYTLGDDTRLDLPSSSEYSKPIELKPGTVLKDQFVIESILGSGGMGIVFKARDLLMEEMRDREPYVAIKVLRPEYQSDQTLLISLQREFRKAQKLSHPNIVGMMDFTRDPSSGAVFITMQYLKGLTLGDLIKEKYPRGMPLEKAIPIIRGMASALDYAHRQNIIHLDFKPGNVFICESGDVKVLDFGIAGFSDVKNPDQERTLFNAIELGALTPSYARLDMIDYHAGQLDSYHPEPKDDVYALGCVVYELLTGRHPYGKASAKDAFLSGLSAKEPSVLGKRRWSQLKRSLAYSRSERLASVESLLKAFEPFSWVSTKSLVALAASSALTFAAILYFQQPNMECQSPVLSDADTQKIKDLLVVAAVDMDVGFLTSPPASNALLAYQEVLKLDPCNLDAANGLGKIATVQEQSAWDAFEKGDINLALEQVTDGLRAAPHHDGLLALKNKLSTGSGKP